MPFLEHTHNDTVASLDLESLDSFGRVTTARASDPDIERNADNKGNDEVVAAVVALDGSELVLKVV